MIEAVIAEITQSDMQASTKSNALALLNMAHRANGHATLAWSEITKLFGLNSISRARKHLGVMQAIGLIHYSTNGDGLVYVTFKAWARVGARIPTTEWSDFDQKVAALQTPTDGDVDRARVGARIPTTKESECDQKVVNSQSPPHTRVLVGCLVDPDLDPDHNQPTNHGPDADAATADPLQPDALQLPAPDAADRARTVALLVDKAVGVSLARARQLAAAHTFEYNRRVVAMYWDQLQSGAVKAGKVITAIEGDWGAPEIPDAWRRTEFYHRHRTPAEIADADRLADEARAAYEQVEPPPPAEDDTPPPYLVDHPAWVALDGDPLAVDLAGLAGVGQIDGITLYQFAARDPLKIEWLDRQIGTKLRRALKARLGHDCLVVIGSKEVT